MKKGPCALLEKSDKNNQNADIRYNSEWATQKTENTALGGK
jgi:hypothetical protein